MAIAASHRRRLLSRGAAQAAQAEATAVPGLRCVAVSPLPSMNGALSPARLRTSLDLAARGGPCGAPARPEAGGGADETGGAGPALGRCPQ